MNEKTDSCKKNTASHRHQRSSILNTIFAYLGELQKREKLNAHQAKKNIFNLLHICIQSQKGLIFMFKIKTVYSSPAGANFLDRSWVIDYYLPLYLDRIIAAIRKPA